MTYITAIVYLCVKEALKPTRRLAPELIKGVTALLTNAYNDDWACPTQTDDFSM